MSTDQKGAGLRAQFILDEVDAQLRYRLVYVLKGIDLLAESQRVLTELSDAAMRDGSLDESIQGVVDAWLQPIDHFGESGYSVISNLTRVAVSMADELVVNATAEVDWRAQARADADT